MIKRANLEELTEYSKRPGYLSLEEDLTTPFLYGGITCNELRAAIDDHLPTELETVKQENTILKGQVEEAKQKNESLKKELESWQRLYFRAKQMIMRG